MKCKLHVGQKVVCVSLDDLRMPPFGWKDLLPVVGKIYTIRGIVPDMSAFHPDYDKTPGVFVEELVRIRWEDDVEVPLYHWRFQPLETREADISVFQNILRSMEKTKVSDGVN